MSDLRPKLCVLEKGASGYGFHLHGEKGKAGQFIRLVEADTPASEAGLHAGDRLAFVNGDSVEGESHQQVVARIRATAGPLELIVVDVATAELLEKHDLRCRKEYVTEGIPLPGRDSDSDRVDAQSNGTSGEPAAAPGENGDAASEKLERLSVGSSTKEEHGGPRPRLCHMKKGAAGYGFNLHSDKTKPGQFIRAVDQDSPAQRAGVRPRDKLVQVNSMSVIGMQHSDVVAAIKAGGDETTLLLVDAEAEDFFNRCNVVPTVEHVTGPLPEPVSERASEEEPQKEAAAERRAKGSLSSSGSSASSRASASAGSRKLSAASSKEPPAASSKEPPAASSKEPPAASSKEPPAASSKEPPAASSKEPPAAKGAPADGLDLVTSLAEAKERARQKRAAKKAPSMDWSKRNELFGNL